MLSLERLETREVYAISLNAGVLTIVGTAGNDVIDVRDSNAGVIATLNGERVAVNGPVNSLVIAGLAGDDDISTFNSSRPAVIDAGDGDDVVQAGGANDVIFANGRGSKTVYDILGVNTLVAKSGNRDSSPDRLYSNAVSTVVADSNDLVVKFFGDGRAPGAGSVQLQDGVLYVTPPDGGSTSILRRDGKDLVLSTSFADEMRFRFKDVDAVAYFGGSGDDVFLNETDIEEVGYGGLGGNDTLVGGTGPFSFLKGGGGDDTLVGRAKRNDLAGNGGSDLLLALGGQSTLRVDALDSYFAGRKDRVLY